MATATGVPGSVRRVSTVQRRGLMLLAAILFGAAAALAFIVPVRADSPDWGALNCGVVTQSQGARLHAINAQLPLAQLPAAAGEAALADCAPAMHTRTQVALGAAALALTALFATVILETAPDRRRTPGTPRARVITVSSQHHIRMAKRSGLAHHGM